MNKVSVVRRLQDNSVTKTQCQRKNRTHAPEQITSDLRRENEEVRHIQTRSTSRCFNLWIRFGSMTRYIFAPIKKDLTSRRPKRATDVVQQAQRRRCRRLSQSWPRQSARIKFLDTEAFTQGSFYTQQLLHREAFTHGIFLHAKAFTHRCLYAKKLFYREKPLRKAVFTHRRVYARKPLRAKAFTKSSFYTRALLHTDAFTHRSFHTRMLSRKPLRTDAFIQRTFAQRPFYTKTPLRREALTQTLLHRDAFTQRSLYTRQLGHGEEITHTQAFTQKI